MVMTDKKNVLLTKLDQIEQRYSEIQKQLAEPAIAADSAKLVALSKEQGKLKAIVAKYCEYKTTAHHIADAEQILQDSTADKELRALAKE